MQIYLGSDHEGYALKNQLHNYLREELKCDVVDLGVFMDDATAYTDIGREVAEKVYENADSFGVLVAGKGTGMCQSAHMHRGMNVMPCSTEDFAKRSRAEDNSNILCLRGEEVNEALAKQIVKTFLSTPFKGDASDKQEVQEVYEDLKHKVKKKSA